VRRPEKSERTRRFRPSDDLKRVSCIACESSEYPKVRNPPRKPGARRVLILGAGLLGLTTALDIRQYPHMSLVGFLDDDPTKYRRLMAGCRVLGHSANLETLSARYKVTDLVICAKSIDPDRVVGLYQRCAVLGVKLHMFPRLDRILRDEGNLPLPAYVPLSFVSDRGERPGKPATRTCSSPRKDSPVDQGGSLWPPP
jgi:FlaA1/EpsC-like NDP-sugar epimerase